MRRIAWARRTVVDVSESVRICTPRMPRMPSAAMTKATMDSISVMPRWRLCSVLVMVFMLCRGWLLGG